MKPSLLVLPLVALGLAQCHHADPSPTDQLPPATQTGAGTFGCLVNGQVWLPSGNNGGPNSVALYDPSIISTGGAQVNIKAYRLGATDTYMTLYCRHITAQKRTFIMNPPVAGQPVAEAFGCYEGGGVSFCNLDLIYLKGQITLTRVDEQAGILTGTFWFTALRQGSSDTLKVTQGRFDYTL